MRDAEGAEVELLKKGEHPSTFGLLYSKGAAKVGELVQAGKVTPGAGFTLFMLAGLAAGDGGEVETTGDGLAVPPRTARRHLVELWRADLIRRVGRSRWVICPTVFHVGRGGGKSGEAMETWVRAVTETEAGTKARARKPKATAANVVKINAEGRVAK